MFPPVYPGPGLRRFSPLFYDFCDRTKDSSTLALSVVLAAFPQICLLDWTPCPMCSEGYIISAPGIPATSFGGLPQVPRPAHLVADLFSPSG